MIAISLHQSNLPQPKKGRKGGGQSGRGVVFKMESAAFCKRAALSILKLLLHGSWVSTVFVKSWKHKSFQPSRCSLRGSTSSWLHLFLAPPLRLHPPKAPSPPPNGGPSAAFTQSLEDSRTQSSAVQQNFLRWRKFYISADHMWLLSPWNVASVTKDLNFLFYWILVNLTSCKNSDTYLVATASDGMDLSNERPRPCMP